MRTTLFKTAAALALLGSVTAQAAPVEQCLTREEIGGMVAYMLPSAMGSVLETCASSLPKDAILLTRGAELQIELEPTRLAALPMAKRAFSKFAPRDDKETAKMIAALPDEAFGPIVSGVVTQKLTGEIKPETCKDIERVFRTIAPLPSQNMLDLFTEALIIAARNDDKMRSCPEA